MRREGEQDMHLTRFCKGGNEMSPNRGATAVLVAGRTGAWLVASSQDRATWETGSPRPRPSL